MLAIINDQDQWNAYVDAHPAGTFCHRYEWRYVIEKTYGLPVQMWGFFDRNRLKGIFPVCHMRKLSRPWERKIVSLPFLDYGGILADEMESAQELLINFKKNCPLPLQIREQSNWAAPFLPQIDQGNCSFQLSLDSDPEGIFSNLRPNIRSNIRKAEKMGMNFEISNSPQDFYKIYAENMHDLGSPVHAYHWFLNVKKFFPDHHRIFHVSFQNKVIGGMICFEFKGILSNPWSSVLRKYRSLKVGPFLAWGAIRFACQRGLRGFDFLRSKIGSGPYEFKKSWGGREIPLFYFSDDPGETISDRLEKYGKLVWIWQKIPLPFANFLGPIIRPLVD